MENAGEAACLLSGEELLQMRLQRRGSLSAFLFSISGRLIVVEQRSRCAATLQQRGQPVCNAGAVGKDQPVSGDGLRGGGFWDRLLSPAAFIEPVLRSVVCGRGVPADCLR